MPENQKCAHRKKMQKYRMNKLLFIRKKIMQKYRINKLLFIIRKLIDKKKFMEGGGGFSGGIFHR